MCDSPCPGGEGLLMQYCHPEELATKDRTFDQILRFAQNDNLGIVYS